VEVITKEIERALEAGMYYLAILGTLTLPDICGALESPDGETTGQRYVAWWNAWMASKYPEISGHDLYKMRCGVVHQGKLGHPKMQQYGRILFLLPTPAKNIMKNLVINDALTIDAGRFCHDMIEAVADWFAAKKNDQVVQANLPRLVRFHANGLPPYIRGIPLIG
jgi:hypothetical protein